MITIQKIEDINSELLQKIRTDAINEYKKHRMRIWRHGSADIVLKKGRPKKIQVPLVENQIEEPLVLSQNNEDSVRRRGRKPKSESHKKRTKEAYKIKKKLSAHII